MENVVRTERDLNWHAATIIKAFIEASLMCGDGTRKLQSIRPSQMAVWNLRVQNMSIDNLFITELVPFKRRDVRHDGHISRSFGDICHDEDQPWCRKRSELTAVTSSLARITHTAIFESLRQGQNDCKTYNSFLHLKISLDLHYRLEPLDSLDRFARTGLPAVIP